MATEATRDGSVEVADAASSAATKAACTWVAAAAHRRGVPRCKARVPRGPEACRRVEAPVGQLGRVERAGLVGAAAVATRLAAVDVRATGAPR